ncbi:MAG: hypothetical protein HQK76_05730 [Desulfobacterales bacterium]|nr:hypothetical protein [Desulfobacterales bacterium]
MNKILFSLIISFSIILQCCATTKLTNERAINLAKIKFIEKEIRIANDLGVKNSSAPVIYETIQKAEILSNDGKKALVQLTIKSSPNIPKTKYIINVTQND